MWLPRGVCQNTWMGLLILLVSVFFLFLLSTTWSSNTHSLGVVRFHWKGNKEEQ